MLHAFPGQWYEESPYFHLVDKPNGFTLCGLDVSGVRLKLKAALNWSPEPELEVICEDCIRLSEPQPVSDSTLAVADPYDSSRTRAAKEKNE